MSKLVWDEIHVNVYNYIKNIGHSYDSRWGDENNISEAQFISHARDLANDGYVRIVDRSAKSHGRRLIPFYDFYAIK